MTLSAANFFECDNLIAAATLDFWRALTELQAAQDINQSAEERERHRSIAMQEIEHLADHFNGALDCIPKPTR